MHEHKAPACTRPNRPRRSSPQRPAPALRRFTFDSKLSIVREDAFVSYSCLLVRSLSEKGAWNPCIQLLWSTARSFEPRAESLDFTAFHFFLTVFYDIRSSSLHFVTGYYVCVACGRSNFRCISGGLCLSFDDRCNGHCDCPFCTDELNCYISSETDVIIQSTSPQHTSTRRPSFNNSKAMLRNVSTAFMAVKFCLSRREHFYTVYRNHLTVFEYWLIGWRHFRRSEAYIIHNQFVAQM